MKKIDIYFKNTLCGQLWQSAAGSSFFEYDPNYLDSSLPAISFTLPKTDYIYESDNFFPFFDGLIPEGWILQLAIEKLRLNPLADRFELFCALCGDAIGAVHTDRPKQKLVSTIVEPHSPKEYLTYKRCLICYGACDDQYHTECSKKIFGSNFIPFLEISSKDIRHLACSSINRRLSLTGVQKKLSLDFQGSGKSRRLTITNFCGQYILKPRGEGPHIPENEHLVMLLAQKAGIKVAPSALISLADGEMAFITKRFDRAQGNVIFHQEDFCQILSKEPYKKYVGSIEQVGKVIEQFADYPGDSLYRLFELVIFNYVVGNVDMHLKNISLSYESFNDKFIQLSPAYDLISTDLYMDDNEQSALAINGKKNKLSIIDFDQLAISLGISKRNFARLVTKFNELLPLWFSVIDTSFLEDHKKEKFKKIITAKLELFH